MSEWIEEQGHHYCNGWHGTYCLCHTGFSMGSGYVAVLVFTFDGWKQVHVLKMSQSRDAEGVLLNDDAEVEAAVNRAKDFVARLESIGGIRQLASRSYS